MAVESSLMLFSTPSCVHHVRTGDIGLGLYKRLKIACKTVVYKIFKMK